MKITKEIRKPALAVVPPFFVHFVGFGKDSLHRPHFQDQFSPYTPAKAGNGYSLGRSVH
jgi:hypothetical protein